MAPSREAPFCREIKEHLRTKYGMESFKHHASGFSEVGVADIIGCWRGRFVAIEAKVGHNQPTSFQLSWLDRYAKVGACTGIVWSLDDLDRVLKEHGITPND